MLRGVETVFESRDGETFYRIAESHCCIFASANKKYSPVCFSIISWMVNQSRDTAVRVCL